jgi:hypothetical protein
MFAIPENLVDGEVHSVGATDAVFPGTRIWLGKSL